MQIKFLKYLPNSFTVINMILGIAVIIINTSVSQEDYRLVSCILILIAAVFDAFDGKIARALNFESNLGKQLDSFADIISFGISPIIVLLSFNSFQKIGAAVYICAALYIFAGALRLARYNLGNHKDFFVGMPITAAGFILTIVNLILHFTYISKYDFTVIAVMILILLLSFLMISKFKIRRI